MEERAKDIIRPPPDECNGVFNRDKTECKTCKVAVECYEENNPP